MTGINFFTTGVEAKRLGLLHELVPRRPTLPCSSTRPIRTAEAQLRDLREAAPRLGLQTRCLHAEHQPRDRCGLRNPRARRADALLVALRPSSMPGAMQFAMLAARHAVPAIY